MRKLILIILMLPFAAFAQEADDLLEPQVDKIKYSYSHEVFTKDESGYSEDWLHLRLGDLTGSVELQDGGQQKVTLNSTLGRMFNFENDGLGSVLHAIQVEARSETKRADWLLLGVELGVIGKFAIYTAAVANDAGSQRFIFGPMYYWDAHTWTSLFLYPGEGFSADGGALNLRHHLETGDLLVEAQATVKSVEGNAELGGGLKVGYGLFSAKAQYSPSYEGGPFNRTSYELALESGF